MNQGFASIAATEVFDKMMNPILILDSKGIVRSVNAAFSEKLQQFAKNIIGIHFLDIGLVDGLTEAAKKQARTRFNAALKKKILPAVEYRFQIKDSAPMFFLTNNSIIEDASGKVEYIILFMKDISEFRLAQEELERSRFELDVIGRISKVFLTNVGDRMFADILDITLDSTKSKHGIFGYVNTNGDMVCPSLTRDIWNQCKMEDKDTIFPREIWGGMWGQSLIEKKTLFSNESFNPPPGHLPMKNAVNVPIIFEGKLLGMLLVGNKTSDYTTIDVEMLEKITEHISPILYSWHNRFKTDLELLQSRQELRTVLNTVPSKIWYKDDQNNFIRVNKAAAESSKMKPDDIEGKSCYEVYPEDAEGYYRDDLEVINSGKPKLGIIENLRSVEGDVMWVKTDKIPILNEKGLAKSIIVISTDITDLKIAEEELQKLNQELEERVAERTKDLVESETRFRSTFISTPIGQLIYELEGADTLKVIDANPAATKILGIDCSSLIGQTLDEAFPALIGTEMPDIYRKVASEGIEWSSEDYSYVDGKIAGAFNIHTYQIGQNRMVVSFEDITHRKHIEEQLTDTQRRLNLSYDNASIGMVWVGNDGIFIRANKAYCETVGYSEDELLTMSWQDLTYPEDYDIGTEIVRRMVDGDVSSGVIEKRYVHKNGRVIHCRLHTVFLQDEAAEEGYFFTQIDDISEAVQMTDALVTSETSLALKNRISEIFLTTPDDEMFDEILAITLAETNSKFGVFGYLNEKDTLIVPSMTRHEWDECKVSDKRTEFPRETWGKSTWVRSILEKRTVLDNRPSVLIPEGHVPIDRNLVVPLIHQATVIGILQVANNIEDYRDNHVEVLEDIAKIVSPILAARLQRDRNEAERQKLFKELQQLNNELEDRVEERTKNLREMQEQLVRNQTLTTLGKISGSVGHELRNPLATIKNSAYFLKMVLDKADTDVLETLTILETEIANCERIINSLLNYARPPEPTIQKVAIKDTIQQALDSIQIPENIKITMKEGNMIAPILGDPHQLMRVIQNLSTNAIQAMPDGGVLTLRTDVKNGYLQIFVQDTGEGIRQENMKKLFEPLFTTKSKGIGLGLSIVKSLVEAHKGKVLVETELGKGTTFIIHLPLMETREGK